jgi:hypothetical protein
MISREKAIKKVMALVSESRASYDREAIEKAICNLCGEVYEAPAKKTEAPPKLSPMAISAAGKIAGYMSHSSNV